jgi:DNA-binding MarR family transcriptional regulator
MSSAARLGPQRPPPAGAEPDPVNEIGPAFKAAMASVRRLRGRERRQRGEMRDAQYSLLFSLWHSGRTELSAGELAHLADLTPATATELLDELEGAGLVQRRRSEQDRRVVLVSFTAQGLAAVEARRRQMEPRWREAFAEFSGEELRTAVAVLERMRQFFDQLAAER